MKALIISDNEYRTETLEKLEKVVHGILSQKGFTIEDARIEGDELSFCMGCLGCWVKKPGECVINDRMGSVNRSYINSDAVFYLVPVIFGHYSANIKNTLDRWLPNTLPFFITGKDGSTRHPLRYDNYPVQVMIGYGDDMTKDESKLFLDITKRQEGPDALIFHGDEEKLEQALNQIPLKKLGGESPCKK